MTEEIKDKDLEQTSGGTTLRDVQNKRREKAANCPNFEFWFMADSKCERSCENCKSYLSKCPDAPK